MSRPWRVETLGGPAARLLDLAPLTERMVRLVRPDDRAVVLGSTQPQSDVDPVAAAAAGTSVLRRRSGGGAVLVGPGLILWVEVAIPVGDPLWTADVGQAFWWLGQVWAAALVAAGLGDAQVWRGPLVHSAWSGRVCFAGLGPGEVTVGGAKVVGLAQRRTRTSATFHCAVAVVWKPGELLALMGLDPATQVQVAAELAMAAIGVGPERAAQLFPLFVDRLP